MLPSGVPQASSPAARVDIFLGESSGNPVGVTRNQDVFVPTACVDTFDGVTFVFSKGALGPGHSYDRSESPSRLIAPVIHNMDKGKTKLCIQ